jgi:hypothetical protein
VDFALQRTIGNFVQSTVDADVTNLQNDINTIRSDVRSFQDDLADFLNDGVDMPPGALQAISAVKAKIGHVVNNANHIIATIRSLTAHAYALAYPLAKGKCAKFSPGSPPDIAYVH